MHRETFIAKLTEVQQTVEQLLAQLQASEHDRFAAHLYPSRREYRVGLPTRREIRQANRAMRHLELPDRREPGLQRRISPMGALAANWTLKIAIPDYGRFSSPRMRSLILTTPTTCRLLSTTGRHGRPCSRMISEPHPPSDFRGSSRPSFPSHHGRVLFYRDQQGLQPFQASCPRSLPSLSFAVVSAVCDGPLGPA
jgi:hypothetical protein